jgi:PhnB protein
MSVKPIPAGYHTVTPYLNIRNTAKAIEFYKTAFGAVEVMRLNMPDGSIGHAEMTIGDSHIMMADESKDWGNLSPETLGNASGGNMIYCDDCDAMFARALAAGAKVKQPLTDQFYGDRSGQVVDPFGHKWTISTHTKDMTPEEISTAMNEWLKTWDGKS